MTPFLLGSYITNEEYLAAPTALRTNNLVPGADQATQDAELAALISKASRKIDSWARQPLYATPGTQNDSGVRIQDGNLVLHAHQDRVKTLSTLAWGYQWGSLNTITNPTAWIEEDRVLVDIQAGGTEWVGNLSALFRPASASSVYASWSYVAGWVTTRLATSAAEGDPTITVENPAGIVPGTALVLTDTDGATKANVTVTSLAGPVVTLAGPLPSPFGATAGVAESEDIKQAAILLVSHYIQARKGSGVVMGKVPTEAKTSDADDDVVEAREIAERWMRVTP